MRRTADFARVLVALVLFAFVTISGYLNPDPAYATSCNEGPRFSAEIWKQSNVVVEGKGTAKLGRGKSSPTQMQVDTVFKGEAERFIDVTPGPCSGLAPEVDQQVVIGLIRGENGSLRPVGFLTIEQARSMTGIGPVVNGRGRIESMVSVDWGQIGLVALDGSGKPLGYVLYDEPPVVVGVCPTGAVTLAIRSDRTGRVIDVIDNATLTRRRVVKLDIRTEPRSVGCLDASGNRAQVYYGRDGAGDVIVADAAPRAALQTYSRPAPPVAITPDGRFVSLVDNLFTSVAAIDPSTGKPQSPRFDLPPELFVHSVAVRNDGQQVAVLARAPDGRGPFKVALFDLATPDLPKMIVFENDSTDGTIRYAGGDVAIAWARPTDDRLQIAHPDLTVDPIGPPRPKVTNPFKSAAGFGLAPRDLDQASLPALPSGPGVGPSPIVEALLYGQQPLLQGVHPRASAIVPGAGVEVASGAGQPPLPLVPPLNQGEPISGVRVGDLIVVALVAVSIAIIVARRRPQDSGPTDALIRLRRRV